MDARNVLVTGGLGFIGSALSEHFLSGGDRVTVVDNKISNVIETRDLDSWRNAVTVVERSVSDYLRDDGPLGGYDLIIHAASYVGPAALLSYHGRIGAEIVGVTEKILEACIAADRPLVYLSSAEVYGKSGALSEEDDLRVPAAYSARVEYALAKLTCEAMILNSRLRGLRSIIIRPFNVVGPLQSRAGGFVFPTFVQQALGGAPITVFGSGKQARAFLDVRDLARFVRDHAGVALGRRPRVYNVGNPDNNTTILALAERIRGLLDSSSPIVHTDGTAVYGPHYTESESFEKLPKIEAAKALGWSPQEGLDGIILGTAEHYRRFFDARGADVRGPRAAAGAPLSAAAAPIDSPRQC